MADGSIMAAIMAAHMRYTRRKSSDFQSEACDGGIHISDIGSDVICQC